jgi:nucleoside-triphosphatase
MVLRELPEADLVTPKLLLTGRPGCGKTTLIKRVVKELAVPAGGFYTEEIREHGGRVGFKLVTLDGEEAVFAHVDFPAAAGPQRLGKYGLDLAALETIGIKALRTAVHARRLIVIDEIGPMEIRSPIFCHAVHEALDSPEAAGILATITARSFPFTNAIKKRPDVTLIEVRSENREQLVCELADQFRT